MALEISEAVLGPRHPNTATSLNNLATLHRHMGNHKAALPLYTRALEIREAVLGPRHPDTASSLNDLVELQKHLDTENEVDGTGERRLTGQCITITGLLGSPHLNGKQGVVLEWMEGQGRYKVQLDDASILAVKPENLACKQPVAVGKEGAAMDVAREELRRMLHIKKKKRTGR